MKKNKKIIIILSLLIVIVIGAIATVYILNQNKKDQTVEVDKGVKTPYKLPVNATEYQKQLFKQLQKNYEAGENEQVAVIVGQLALSDFFTLSNKNTRNDIGAVEFMLNDMAFRKEFVNQALSNYYGFFEELKLKYGAEQLPTVTNVAWQSTSDAEFAYNDMVFDKVIKMNYILEYDTTKSYDISTLHTQYSVTMVSMNGVWYVVAIDLF